MIINTFINDSWTAFWSKWSEMEFSTSSTWLIKYKLLPVGGRQSDV